MLAARGVCEARVRERWPELRPLSTATLRDGHAPEVESTLDAAINLLGELPRPVTLATEHLLLGLVAAAHETSAWLAEQGFVAHQLAAEIERLNGHAPELGPLPMLEEENGKQKAESGKPKIESDAAAQSPPDTSHQPPATSHQPPATSHQPPATSLRILDAAANRASEGLRVVEDFARFALDDAHLTGLLKDLRHDLAAALSAFPTKQLLACRETQADVGTSISTPSEQHRADAAGVLTANFKRLQEALRSLEEYGKLLDPAAGPRFEQLRYRSYTLQRAVEITRASRDRLATARLYVLLDGRPTLAEFERLAASLVAAGVSVLQLRDKTLADRVLLARARALRAITRGTGTLFIMNDRPDLAALAEADGVHVGQEELTVKDARRIVGPNALVGVSTHSLAQARQAVLDGADYIGVGPVFPSSTKNFAALPGLNLLREIAREITLPSFAIGGITTDNLADVQATGFSRIALSAAITQAANPDQAAAKLLSRLSPPASSLQPTAYQ